MKSAEKIAVVDIGSNSCRMVIYEQSGAALIPYFNEKAMAGLGRDLSETGRLSPTGSELALQTFHRFRAITASLNIKNVRAVATAAVREASDGPEFKKRAEAILGAPIKVLSGADEGRLSAVGVSIGFLGPKGLIADLGGTSMELRPVDQDAVGESFLLGPLARAQDTNLPFEKRRKTMRKILANSEFVKTAAGQDLFAVGGAWRNVAAVHMMLRDYPLRVAHGYKMTQDDVENVIEAAELARSDKLTREQLLGVSKRRFDTLPHAALLLKTLMEQLSVDKVTISSFGLRDGVAADGLEVDGATGLLDAVPLFLRSTPQSKLFGRELYSFIHPISKRFKKSETLLRAICSMADAGARMHPDHRAQLVYEQVLRAPVPSMSHSERLFAAYAAASRYTFKLVEDPRYARLLGLGAKRRAKVLGTAMRLGSVYSGRSGAILATAKLAIKDDTLSMTVDKAYSDLVSETVGRRLSQLAGLMQLQPRLTID
ncbi:MAG: Ppx/GppA family phosphatase [Henriciella sp.]|nr:Ppx/GppA family phosphatase [Henriciella sp.]